MVSIFILHSSHDFYISACLEESLIDDHLLNTMIKNPSFRPKTLHKIKLDVLFSSNIIIQNKFSKVPYPPDTDNPTNSYTYSSHPGMEGNTPQVTSSNNFQNSSCQHSNTQQYTQQYDYLHSSDDDIIRLNYKKQNMPTQSNMQTNNNIPSNFSKSNIKIHNTNSLIYNNNTPTNTDTRSNRIHSYRNTKNYQHDQTE